MKNNRRTLNEIMSQVNGVELKENKDSRFKFRLYVTKNMNEALLDTLDVSLRSYNSLRRAGFDTVGDLINALSSGFDLKTIRSCGKSTVRDIMEHLFIYQYNLLPENKRNDYLMETVKLNKK